MVYSQKKYCLAISFIFLWLGLSSCATKVTRDLSEGSKEGNKWELITVQPDYIDNVSFLAISHLDGEKLPKPLIFGLDVVLLPPGDHQLRLVLGGFENYEELLNLDDTYDGWWADLGDIQLKEPLYEKGRNYLVASYDKIYSSNTKSPKYMQYWLVNYPRTIDAAKNWSVEPLDPELEDVDAAAGAEEEASDSVAAEADDQTEAQSAE